MRLEGSNIDRNININDAQAVGTHDHVTQTVVRIPFEHVAGTHLVEHRCNNTIGMLKAFD